jgi:hypothetical protein
LNRVVDLDGAAGSSLRFHGPEFQRIARPLHIGILEVPDAAEKTSYCILNFGIMWFLIEK